MKKLIAIIITLIFIFEGMGYGLPYDSYKPALRPSMYFGKDRLEENAKSIAVKEVMARIEKIKAIAGQVDIKELERLKAMRNAADAKVNESRTEETENAQTKAEKDYTDKIKEMQAKHLESLIDSNQLLIETFDIIMKLDEKDAEEVINAMLGEFSALKDWAYKYVSLVGGESQYSTTICDIAALFLRVSDKTELTAKAILKRTKESLEEHRWATGKLDCPRPEFKSEKEKKEYMERTQIAIR